MPKKIFLLVIDAQRGFCDPTLNGGKGELFVGGADDDTRRLTAFIERAGKHLEDIDLTFDSHHKLHIGHGLFWRDAKGDQPPPFTPISAADVAAGTWYPRVPQLRAYATQYLTALAAGGRYPHTVWPDHCLIGTEGHQLMPELMAAVLKWEQKHVAFAGKHSKGSCIYTEHFSAVKAEVPHPEDPATQLNTGLVKKLQTADQILVAGQALSHCVANTVRDVADAFGDPELVKKFVLLTDCTSNVPGCDALGRAFVDEFRAKGLKTALSTDVL